MHCGYTGIPRDACRSRNFSEALRWGTEVFPFIAELIKDEGMSTAVGDEGGFAPEFKSQEDALDHLVKAIPNAGFEPGKDFVIAIDAASSEWKSDKGIGFYHQPKIREKVLYIR